MNGELDYNNDSEDQYKLVIAMNHQYVIGIWEFHYPKIASLILEFHRHVDSGVVPLMFEVG